MSGVRDVVDAKSPDEALVHLLVLRKVGATCQRHTVSYVITSACSNFVGMNSSRELVDEANLCTCSVGLLQVE